MSPVDFKKRPCHPVEFKGQGPTRGRETTGKKSVTYQVLLHQKQTREEINRVDELEVHVHYSF